MCVMRDAYCMYCVTYIAVGYIVYVGGNAMLRVWRGLNDTRTMMVVKDTCMMRV